jgi:uncharacterized protein (DUF433 family)
LWSQSERVGPRIARKNSRRYATAALSLYTKLGEVSHDGGCVITKDPDILGGERVFRGTRVPFKVLTDYLEGGDTVDQFLERYPSVSRELAIAAIEEARLSLIAQLK